MLNVTRFDRPILTAQLQQPIVRSLVPLDGEPTDGGFLQYDGNEQKFVTTVPDSEMSSSSENIVKNKTIKKYVDDNLEEYTKTEDLGDLAMQDTVNYSTQVTNKPAINNGTLTIQANGETIGTFGANSSEDVTININATGGVQSDWSQNDSSEPDYIKNKPTIPSQASDVGALPDSTKYGAGLRLENGSTLHLKDQNGSDLGDSVTISTEDTGATSVETTGYGNAVTTASYDSSTRKITLTKGTEFQTANDNSLDTTAKNVVSAINEVNSVAKNANIAKGFTNYQALITELNSASSTDYKVGQSFYVQTLEVPDLWIISVESTSSTYTYTTDSAFVTATGASGGQQVGYYKIAQQETQKVDLTNYVQKSTTIAGVDLQDNIPKSEMQTALDFDTKLDKITSSGTYTRLYSVSADGSTQSSENCSDTVVNSAVIKRNSSGQIKVPTTPTANDDAVAKQYVDNKTTILIGSSAPTTNTPADFVGQLYFTAGSTYQCTAINEDTSTTPSTFTYTWVRLIRATNLAGVGSVGVVSVDSSYGIGTNSTGRLYVSKTSTAIIDARTTNASAQYRPITPDSLNYAVKASLTDANHLTMTSAEKAVAQSVLGFVTLTQADYDALVLAGTVDSNIYYFIVEV